MSSETEQPSAAECRRWRALALIGTGLAALVVVVVGLMIGWLPGVLCGLAFGLGGSAYYVQQRWQRTRGGGERERQFLRVQNLVENIFPSVVEIRNGEIVYVAPGQERITGFSSSDLIGKRWLDFVHAEDLDSARAWLDADKPEGGLEVRVRHKQGHLIWTKNYAVARSEMAGKAGFTIAAYDAAEEREAREALVQAQRLEGLGVIAGGIAHDFNNLLTVIAGFTEMLEDGEVRRNVLEAADDAAVLVQRLMAFGANNAREEERTNIGQLVQSMRPALASTLGSAVQLTVQAESDAWVPLSSGELGQIFLNLVANCRDALPGRGGVWIEVVCPEPAGPAAPEVHVRVRDDGPGMDAHVLENAFDPFFSTKAKMFGTGLGLASVRGIVEQAGGRVRLSSTLGEGTAVTLELPRVEGALPEAVPPEPVAILHGSGNVLLVEDEGLVADLVARSLLKAGYSVTIKNDVESAWQHLQMGLPDLLITDIMMPDGRGTELAQRLSDAAMEVPILFISGYSDTEIGEWRDAGGQVKFLAKPFRRQDLLDRVAHLVNRRSMVS